jgi:ribosomal protein L7/L12
MAYDEYLNPAVDDLQRRMQAVEAQVALLSQTLGVPFAPAVSFASAAGAIPADPTGVTTAYDPRYGAAADPRAASVPGVPPAGAAEGGVPPDVLALARAGKKIEAIKRYRMLTNVSLKAAKDVIDRL